MMYTLLNTDPEHYEIEDHNLLKNNGQRSKWQEEM